MKIFAIGLNYASHNKEMQRTFEAAEPVIFMKPDTALLRNGNPFFLFIFLCCTGEIQKGNLTACLYCLFKLCHSRLIVDNPVYLIVVLLD